VSGADSDLAPGTMIAGRFRVESLLGTGGMADVYRAVDAATGAPIAVKLLREDVGRAGEAVERVRREGEVLRALAHPAIVKIETFGQAEDGRIFIAMELLEGETLGDVMRRGRLSPKELVPIVAGTCAGLAAAHEKGVVHRDLKPDNIFLAKAEDGVQVKLLDFGIAKVNDAANKLTQTGEVLGTPRYMAPEQLSAERDLDGRTDVYALGIILYEALAGQPPYLASNPTDLIVAILHGKHAPLTSHRKDVSSTVEAVIARAMARAREARFASSRDLAEAFVNAVSDGVEKAEPQREGMATAFLGSLGEGGPGASTSEPDLKPGTFSELEQVSKDDAERRKRALARTDPAGGAGEADETRGKKKVEPTPVPRVQYTTRPSNPGAIAGAHSATPVVHSSTPTPYGGPTPSQAEYQLPTSGGGTKLIVVGLLAGALSAGLAIAALSFLGSSETPEEPATAASPEGETVAAAPPEDVNDEPEEEVAAEDADAPDEIPQGAAPPEVEAEPRVARRRGTRMRRQPSMMTTEPPDMEPPAMGGAPSAAELTQQARGALRDGDPRRCVELSGQALAAGAGPATARLRGDCLLGVGDRRGALAAYERFCRTARNHPSANEVRSIVEGMGGSCD